MACAGRRLQEAAPNSPDLLAAPAGVQGDFDTEDSVVDIHPPGRPAAVRAPVPAAAAVPVAALLLNPDQVPPPPPLPGHLVDGVPDTG
jgi:hypothetical protein